jgi:arylsulfatase
MAEKAIQLMRISNTLTPGKPFLLYFTPGAVHGPHHIFKEWADKYDAKFDDGWADLRKMTFEKQKALGWIPKDSVFNPFAKGMQKWDKILSYFPNFRAD